MTKFYKEKPLFKINQLFISCFFLLLLISTIGFAETTKNNQQAVISDKHLSKYLTDEEKQWIKKNPVVIASGTKDFPPYDFVNKQGEHQGIVADYLTLIQKHTGLNFNVQIDDWPKHIKNVKQSKIDIIGGITHTKEREDFLIFSKSYMDLIDYFFIRKGLPVNSIEELNNYRIAVPEGYMSVNNLKKILPDAEIIIEPNLNIAIDSVILGKADALFQSYSVINYILQQEKIDSIIPFKQAQKQEKHTQHFATRKDAPILASIIQKGLEAITPQERRVLFKKWNNKMIEKDFSLNKTEIAWIQQNPTITYGAEISWAPYDFVDKDRNHIGITRDLLDYISKKTGLIFNPKVDLWSQLIEDIKNNKIDLLPALHYSKERNKFLLFTDSYTATTPYFFIDKNIIAFTTDDLNGLTVAVTKGFSFVETLRQHYPDINILEVNNLDYAIAAVLEGKAQLIVESHSTANYVFKQKGIRNIRPFKALTPGIDNPIYMGTNKQQLILRNIIDKTLKSMNSLEKDEIFNRWLGIDYQELSLLVELSKEEREWLKDNKTFKFAGDPDWLPIENFNKNGKYEGIAADFLTLIEKYLNITFEKIPTKSWHETFEIAKRHEVDVISEITGSELENGFIFTEPYFKSPIVLLMRNDQKYVNNLNEIADKKIAVIKNYGYTPLIKSKYNNIEFIEVESLQEGLHQVSTGKIDALTCTLVNASYELSNLGINNLHIVGQTDFNTEMAFGISEKYQPLVPIINKVLEAIDQEEKKYILEKWSQTNLASKTDYGPLIKVATALLGLIIFFYFWNRRLANEIEQRKISEANLSSMNRRFSLAADTVSLGVWQLNYNNGDDTPELHFDDKMYELYQIDKNQKIVWQQWLEYIHKEDRHNFLNSIEQLRYNDGKELFKFRIITENKELHYIYAGLIREKNGSDTTKIVGVNWDISQIEEAQQALETAKEAAENANKAKSSFLANMSHEIRTPMNSIIGFTELLNEQVTEPRHKAYIKTIKSAGNSLLSLINDILDLSKIEAGKFEIQTKPCNPYDLINDVSNIFSIRMREKDLDFILDVVPNIPESLQLDEIRIRQIILNLLGNAVKFTEKGHVKVRAYATNKDEIKSKVDLIIEVEDTGIGISKEDQTKIFSEFQQSTNQDQGRYGGTGLGLSISSRLAKLMGGNILLTSQLGEGSTFSLKLDNVNVSAIKQQRTEQEKSLDNKVIEFSKASVLVVDDIADNRKLLIANFADSNISIDTAENGKEAVDKAIIKDYDLVFMDIRMPVMDGYEASTLIKTSKPQMPIVALTASVMHDEFERIKNEYFDGYLRKPVLRADLFKETCRFIAFEEVEAKDTNNDTETLSSQEKIYAKAIIDELKSFEVQCETLIKNNNINDIQKFVKQMSQLTSRQPIALVQKYVTALQNDLDSFNIIGIKSSLQDYSKLIAHLDSEIR